MVDNIEALFPKLQTETYRVSSPRTGDYNCIAWAAADTTRWWWPDADPDNDAMYWPPGVAREETVEAFVAVFAGLDYLPCDSPDLETGFEKIALFADAHRVPTHAARQLPTGRWTSKLGFLEDIEHDLDDLAGELYGTMVLVLKRPARPWPPPSGPA